MMLLEEMQGAPRSMPGLRKTIDSILNVVRQSRDAEGAPQADTADAAELMKMFRDDLKAEAVPGEATGRRDVSGLTAEEEEAADLARIRRALYEV